MLAGKSEGQRQPEMPICMWKDNIKWMLKAWGVMV
jgi:hypothetical protein